MKKICPQCGKKFYTLMPDSTYCSNACRVKACREKIKAKTPPEPEVNILIEGDNGKFIFTALSRATKFLAHWTGLHAAQVKFSLGRKESKIGGYNITY